MMQIRVQSNIEEVARRLPRALRKQVPFAASQALSDTAKYWKFTEGPKSMKRDLDKPVSWSYKGGLRYIRANKRNLTAVVYVQHDRWAYLKYQVNGGIQKARNSAIPIAQTEIPKYRRNVAGNIPRGGLAKAIARKDTFWGTLGGTYGLWQKTKGSGRKYRLITAMVPRAVYPGQQWGYAQSVDRAVSQRFNRAFGVRVSRAIKSANL